MHEAIYRTAIERIFIAFAMRDHVLRLWLQQQVERVDWHEDELHFSIEELFCWAYTLHTGTVVVSTVKHTPLFLAFRRQLYQQPTNTELRAYGVQVQLCENYQHQPKLPRRYTLRRLMDVVAPD